MPERRVAPLFVWLVSGMMLGAAELVPGASAASLAIVLGIYPRLLNGLSGRSSGPAHPPGGTRFGIDLIAIAVGAGAVVALLRGLHDPQSVAADSALGLLSRAFWFGFLAVALPFVAARVERWSIGHVTLLLTGAVLGIAATRVEFVQIAAVPGPAFAGALAAGAALLVPGGFGWSALHAGGLADHALTAFGHDYLWFLLPFLAGLLAGVVLAAHVLRRLLARYPDALLALLLGVMYAGLPRAWPWLRIDAYTLTIGGDTAAVVTTPLWPGQYFATTGAEANSVAACLVMAAAGLLALLVARGRGFVAPP